MSEQSSDILHRVAAINADTLLAQALRKSEPGNKRGNTSKCWTLDGHTRFEAAKMHIVDHKSAAEIRSELADRFDAAKVSTRALSTWLKSIRKAYGVQHDAYLAEMEAYEAVAFQSGDLVAVLAITMAAIAPKFIGWAKTLDFAGAENKEQHVLLRFLGTQIDAAKVQAEAKRTEAQTLNIMGKLREAASMADGESTLTPEERAKEVARLIREAMGLGSVA